MQSFIPNSVSPDDLNALLITSDIHPSEVLDEVEPDDLHDHLWQVANRHLTAMFEEYDDPLVHKVAALIVLRRLVDWHVTVSEEQLARGSKGALGWASDAANLELAWQLLKGISIGDDDPYCE